LSLAEAVVCVLLHLVSLLSLWFGKPGRTDAWFEGATASVLVKPCRKA
jgi:hypothetical protein